MRTAPDADGLCSPPEASAQAPVALGTNGVAWSLWLWVAAGFLFMGLLWAAMFVATRQADTRAVPLATKEGCHDA